MKIKNILISQTPPLDVEKSPYGDLKKKYSINLEFFLNFLPFLRFQLQTLGKQKSIFWIILLLFFPVLQRLTISLLF